MRDDLPNITFKPNRSFAMHQSTEVNPRMRAQAKDIVTAIVNRAITPMAKCAGFKKSGLNFDRRLNNVVQVISLQLSQWTGTARASFSVNIGLAFESLWEQDGQTAIKQPKEHQCHARTRIDAVIPGASGQWNVDIWMPSEEIQALSAALEEDFKRLLTELDQLSSPGSFLKHGWLRFPLSHIALPARLSYLNEDYDMALFELRRAYVTPLLRNEVSLQELIDKYNMPKLLVEHCTV